MESLALHVSQSSLWLSGARTIMQEDVRAVLSRAVPPGDYRAVTIVSVRWDLDGEPMESPVAEYGEVLDARVEMLIER
jgi:hypothetical protein